jgi:hypothetical protein
MHAEHLILQSVVVSVAVDGEHKRSAQQRTRNSESKKLLALFKRFDGRNDVKVFVANRSHTLSCSVTSPIDPHKSSSGQEFECAGVVALVANDDSEQQTDIKFKLSKQSGRSSLMLTFNPSQILTGADAQPTLIHRQSGKKIPCPSSSREVTNKMFALGFDLLQLLPRRNVDNAFFESKINPERIRVHRIQWDAFLPVSDPRRFLQLLPILYEQTVIDDQGVVKLAADLGLSLKYSTDPQTSEVTAVTIEKLNGRKKLFAVKFSMSGLGDRGTNDSSEVRLAITAYSDGIWKLARSARRKLATLTASDPERFEQVKEILERDVDFSGHQVATALRVLAYDQSETGTVRRSFGEWLVPFVLNDLFRLDVIGGFTHAGLHHVVELEHEVARAWRETVNATRTGWAGSLAEKADVTDETVYARQREWLQAHGIDIWIPYSFYADLLSLGSLSAAEWERRAGIVAAVARDDAKEVLAQVSGAIDDFDEQRLRLIGNKIGSRLRRVDVVGFDNPLTNAGASKGRKALSPASGEHRHLRKTSSTRVALRSGSKDDLANYKRIAGDVRDASKRTPVARNQTPRKKSPSSVSGPKARR